MSYNELEQRGSVDFPCALYSIDRTHPKYEMACHWHTELELIRVLEGTLDVTLNNKTFRAEAGDLVFVNSEVVHSAVPDGCVYECIVFDASFFRPPSGTCRTFVDGLTGHTIYVQDHFEKPTGALADTANALFLAMEKGGEGYRFSVIGEIYRLFGLWMEQKMYTDDLSICAVQNEKNVLKLKRVLSFIRSSYDTQITLEDMASSAGVSPKYFCSFFKEMTGKTPVEYLNMYRVERAARKLLGTDLSVTQVAFACGFNDLSYFIKTFKSVKGITPKNFRKNGAH